MKNTAKKVFVCFLCLSFLLLTSMDFNDEVWKRRKEISPLEKWFPRER